MKTSTLVLLGVIAYLWYQHSTTATTNPQPGDPNFIGPVYIPPMPFTEAVTSYGG